MDERQILADTSDGPGEFVAILSDDDKIGYLVSERRNGTWSEPFCAPESDLIGDGVAKSGFIPRDKFPEFRDKFDFSRWTSIEQ
jgi:hypothetical protein